MHYGTYCMLGFLAPRTLRRLQDLWKIWAPLLENTCGWYTWLRAWTYLAPLFICDHQICRPSLGSQNYLRLFKHRDSASLYKKVPLNKLLQVRRWALLVAAAFCLMFECKNVLALTFQVFRIEDCRNLKKEAANFSETSANTGRYLDSCTEYLL
jgi:hypothetical protein